MATQALSSRECQVLDLLADGLKYKQIALRLGLSTSTVRTHLHKIYAKLGVHDRAQAVLAYSGGRHDGHEFAEDRELYHAIRRALGEIADRLRSQQRDRLTSRQHAYLDAYVRVFRTSLRSDHEQAIDEATAAFRELLAESGCDVISEGRRLRVRRVLSTVA